MASPLPAVQYLVAFSDPMLTDPATITTIASPAGTLGATGVWTDITAYVDSHDISRGRQHELNAFEAGTCQLHLNDNGAAFNPFNSSGPYYGFLVPKKILQVRATWSGVTYTRFTGHVDSWLLDWPDQTSAWMTLHATDAFRFFNTALMVGDIYANRVQVDRPAGMWPCTDPARSTTLADTSGNGHPLTITGVINFNFSTATADPPFSSTTGTVVSSGLSYDLADQISVPSNTAYTVELWFKTATVPSPGPAALWMAGSGTNIAGLTITTGGKLATVSSTSGQVTTYPGATTVNNNAWHHVALTFDPVANTQTVYLDGNVEMSQYLGAPAVSWSPGTAQWLYIDATYSGLLSIEMAYLARWSSALAGANIVGHHVAAVQMFPQQTSDARIGLCLDVAPWPSGARSIDSGNSSVQASTGLGSTTILSHMQSVEATEFGALFMTTDGKVKFVSRDDRWSNSLYRTSQATIGDNTAGGDLPLQPGPTLGLDDIDIYNDANATRSGGAAQDVVNFASINMYGRQTWMPPATLINLTDAEVANMLGVVVGKYNAPVERIQAVTVDLLELITPNLVATLLALDLLYRVTIERTVVPGGGSGFSQAALIERMAEKVTPDSWTVTLQLAIVDNIWVLGTSQLGVDTMLGY